MTAKNLTCLPSDGEDGGPTVATILEPIIRPRLDAATEVHFAAVHRDSLLDVLHVMRERSIQAVLMSPSMIEREDLPLVGALMRQFPGVPAVAVVSQHDPSSSERLLELGTCGVRSMVDLATPDAWNALRGLVADPFALTAGLILRTIIPVIGDATEETRCFFEMLAHTAPRVRTVLVLCRSLRINPSSMVSRFYRAGLPSPKCYLAATRLLHAAALLHDRQASVSHVAYRLDYSSPQSFGRHVRVVMGMTAGEFRTRYPLAVALKRYTASLITPFEESFSSFHPLGQREVELSAHHIECRLQPA